MIPTSRELSQRNEMGKILELIECGNAYTDSSSRSHYLAKCGFLFEKVFLILPFSGICPTKIEKQKLEEENNSFFFKKFAYRRHRDMLYFASVYQ